LALVVLQEHHLVVAVVALYELFGEQAERFHQHTLAISKEKSWRYKV
jgi:hypothetical protein